MWKSASPTAGPLAAQNATASAAPRREAPRERAGERHADLRRPAGDPQDQRARNDQHAPRRGGEPEREPPAVVRRRLGEPEQERQDENPGDEAGARAAKRDGDGYR